MLERSAMSPLSRDAAKISGRMWGTTLVVSNNLVRPRPLDPLPFPLGAVGAGPGTDAFLSLAEPGCAGELLLPELLLLLEESATFCLLLDLDTESSSRGFFLEVTSLESGTSSGSSISASVLLPFSSAALISAREGFPASS